MSPIATVLRLIFSPFRWLKRLFMSQVRLKRSGLRFRLVLEDGDAPPPQPAAPTPSAKPKAVASSEPDTVADEPANDMQRDLAHLISQHAQTRRLMRHLAYTERALKLAGADALDTLPLEVLKKSLAQLEELVTDWSSPGLAELRLRLTMLVTDKESAAAHFEPTNSALSDFHTPKRMAVSEGTPSDFRAAQDAWSDTAVEGACDDRSR